MANQAATLGSEYLDRKRRELTRLRDALRGTADAEEAEETDINSEAGSQAREYEDDAQRLDTLELAGGLVGRDVQRLRRVERALEKIDEGTYGLSDVSGDRIPDSRLEAMPDAINTVAEQERIEQIG
jgi:DnaK suppressor protein